MENEMFDSVVLITRTISEQFVYAKFIMMADSVNRGEAFLYSYRIQSAIKTDKLISSMDKSGLFENVEEIKEALKKSISQSRSEINSTEDYINFYKNQFEQKLKMNYNPKKIDYEKWYNLNGKIPNFKELMKFVGMDESYYNYLYGVSSMNVHGIDAAGNIGVEDNQLMFKRFNNIEAVTMILMKYLFELTNNMGSYYNVRQEKKFKNLLKKMELNYKFMRKKIHL